MAAREIDLLQLRTSLNIFPSETNTQNWKQFGKNVF